MYFDSEKTENLKMKKLLVTASTFPRHLNDTEPRFIYDLCLELSKYYDITVLLPAFANCKKQELMGSINIIRYKYFFNKFQTLAYPGAIASIIKQNPLKLFLVPFLLYSLYKNTKRLLASGKFDVVHINWFIPQGVIQGRICKKLNIPYLLTGHSGDVSSFNYKIVKSLKKKAFDYAKKATFVSTYLQQNFEKNYKISDYSKVSIAPFGCNTKNFNVEKNRKISF